jgi:DNA-binding protein H-NS
VSETYAELKAKITELEKRAAEMQRAEMAGAITQIKAIMTQYGITVAHLGTRGNAAATKSPGVAKYIDKATGQTWTGRGKPPKWIPKDDAARADFLIGADSAAASTAPVPVPAPKALKAVTVAKAPAKAVAAKKGEGKKAA